MRAKRNASALCPDEEGIKTETRPSGPVRPGWLQLSALTKKGLRRLKEHTAWCRAFPSALCPDEEGIKTSAGWRMFRRASPSALCPDEEGIKTQLRPILPHGPPGLQLSALTKKGLRPAKPSGLSRSDSLQLSALTKKGLRPWSLPVGDVVRASALCPDEEGIKTRRGRVRRPLGPPSALCPDEEGIKTPSSP